MIPFVGKFGFVHIESDFSRLRLISFRGDELKLGIGIDKTANEPRACHPVYMNTFTRNPGATLKVLKLLFGFSRFPAEEPSCSRASKAKISRSAPSLPVALKKSIATTSAMRL